MIKAILTDLDGVIRKWDPHIVWKAETAAGLPRDALLTTAFEPGLLRSVTTGRITDEAWRSEVANRLRHSFPVADAEKAVRLWSRSPGEIDAVVMELLQRCRKSCRVALITNATTRLESDLQRLGIDQAFDHIVNSSSVGHAKPDSEIFTAALKLLNIRPNEALFIDDRVENATAAVARGMIGHHYTTCDSLRQSLTRCRLPI